MKLRTERLDILPLDVDMLWLLLDDMPGLEARLGCIYRGEPIEGEFRRIVASQYEIVLYDSANYLWHSFWLLIRRDDGTVVGSADFKAPPDKLGRVEIGYGLGAQFERRGYMTEAADAMCRWALGQENVKNVVAETENGNLASQRVLRRCGFRELSQGATKWWIL